MTDRQMELSRETAKTVSGIPKQPETEKMKMENSLNLDENWGGKLWIHQGRNIKICRGRELAFHETANHLSGLSAPGSAVNPFRP